MLEGAVDAVEALFPALSASTDEDDDQDEDDDKPEPATVVVDVLLALLRRPSAFVKAFAGPVVLKGLAEDVGLQAVELLRDVVAPEEDEVEEEEEQDGEGEAAADKKASKKAAAAAALDESDDDGASSSGSDSDSDDEGGFEVDEAFKNELLAALEAGGMGVPGDDEPMRDGGEESDDEELLDDEAMLELDDKLADIFRANGGGRKSKKRASLSLSLSSPPSLCAGSTDMGDALDVQVTARTTCTTACAFSTSSTSSPTPRPPRPSSSRSTSRSST